MNGILILMMCAAVGGAVVLARKAGGGTAWAVRPAGLLAVLALALAVVGIRDVLKPRRPDMQREVRYREVIGRVAGAYLPDNFEGNALVLTPCNYPGQSPVGQELLSALVERLGDGITVVGIEEPSAPESYVQQLKAEVERGDMLPFEMKMELGSPAAWFETAGLYQIVRRQSERIDLLIMMAPLPEDFTRVAMRNGVTWPRIFLLDPLEQNTQELLATGKMAGLIITKPLDQWQSPSTRSIEKGDDAEVFNQRYQLIAGNGEEIDVSGLPLKEALP